MPLNINKPGWGWGILAKQTQICIQLTINTELDQNDLNVKASVKHSSPL